MGLTIELSFSINKVSNVTQFKEHLSDLAENCDSSSHYFIHEIEGHSSTIDRNDCIHHVEFISSKQILNFLKKIMQIKKVKVDCIYIDKKRLQLIYASKKYLLMNKNSLSKPISSPNPIINSNLLQLVANYIDML